MDKNLEKRIAQLEKWQKERMNQQISYPLDINSIRILNQYFMQLTGTVRTVAGVGANEFTYYIGRQNGTQFQFQVEADTFIPYSVNVSTNFLTVSPRIQFQEDMQVYFSTSDSAPSPIDTSGITQYFVINASSNGVNFQITTVQGSAGDIVNITDNGTGQQYIYFF